MRFYLRASIKPICKNHVFRAVLEPFYPLKRPKTKKWLRSLNFGWNGPMFGRDLRYYRLKTYQKVKVVWDTFVIWNTLMINDHDQPCSSTRLLQKQPPSQFFRSRSHEKSKCSQTYQKKWWVWSWWHDMMTTMIMMVTWWSRDTWWWHFPSQGKTWGKEQLSEHWEKRFPPKMSSLSEIMRTMIMMVMMMMRKQIMMMMMT